jgi:homoserine O-acetyltransferase
MVRHRAACLALSLSIVVSAPMSSQAPRTPPGNDFVMRNFRFADGETLPELRIHYITLGTLRKDANGGATNAVLILHGTTGAGTQFLSPSFAGVLYGPGQTLDTARYFIVLPDGIGHGKSSKPSDGLHARFPKYTYDDMVDAQHRLLTEALGVAHLRLVMGTSMGGMHTWVWGERYPDFMDALVPLACVPTQIAGRNRMMRTMIMDAIRDDPDYRGGDYTTQPRGLRTSLGMLFMMTSSPLNQHRTAPTRDAADKQIRDYIDARMRTMDANDVLYAYNASRDYDPSTQLEKIRAPLLAINSADDVVNPPELGLMEKLMPRVAHGRYVLIPTSEATRGHGTHTMAAVWGSHFAEFMGTVPEGRAEGPRP